MFSFQVTPHFNYENPPIQIIGQAPDEKIRGRIGFIIQIPNTPTIQVMFDRNQAEDFLSKLRDANDVAKGLKK